MPTSTRTRTIKRTAKPSPSGVSGGATRAQLVWISFMAAMTLAGGMLFLLDGKPAPRADGLSLSPLAAATTIGAGPAGGERVDPVTQTHVPLDTARWQAVVVHHSGSMIGSPMTIAREHESRGIRGLGHHFIIGNGSGMDDGQVHIGFRWLDQLPGAHVAGAGGEWYNLHAISICLVGDGDRRAFTPAQIQQLTLLIDSLRRQLNIPADRVYLHSDVAPEVSDPGRLFPEHVVRGVGG